MRALALAVALFPCAAAAQVDVTYGPATPPGALHVLVEAVGPRSEAHPAVAWCVADAYRVLAERTDDDRIAAAARRAARQYERVAAARLARRPGAVPEVVGAVVTVPVREGAVCRTRVRAVFRMDG